MEIKSSQVEPAPAVFILTEQYHEFLQDQSATTRRGVLVNRSTTRPATPRVWLNFMLMSSVAMQGQPETIIWNWTCLLLHMGNADFPVFSSVSLMIYWDIKRRMMWKLLTLLERLSVADM